MAEATKNKDLEDDEIAVLLKTVVEHFSEEDRMTRERQIRHWRRLKLYWNNFSQVYWSEVAHDYRIYNRDLNATDTDQDYYDKPVNVFKAFLETIIAALSIQIPAINCAPDDAENPLDALTAKAGDKIAELVYKHNDVTFLWLHALYIYCTEGLIACYSYSKEDKSYGTYDQPKFKDEEVEAYVCPHCGTKVPDEEFSRDELDEFSPDDDDAELHSELKEKGPHCFECGVKLDPELQKTKLIVPRLIGVTKKPKSRICLEVKGGLNVKVANYARTQAETPYLIDSYETHYANALQCYPNLREKIPHGGWSNIGVTDPYEQYARLNTQYRGEFPDENVTIKCAWLRPAAFQILADDDYKALKKKFPDGACVELVNDIVAKYENESLDDHWTLTQNPMSDFINHDPLGELITNIQDIINDLISLTLQTIEHGIAQTWADPAIVNFAAQKQIEAMPGTITPTKPVSGTKRVSEGFYTSQLATLNPEIFAFYKIIQELGQFVTGALPSLFGGQLNAGSSRTAQEYQTSKAMALQRLQTPWKMLTIWWKKIFGKVIPMYIKNVVEDERIVEKNEQGNFVNVFIRKAELGGKIGSIELEPAEKLPVTDEQQADMIMQLFNLNNQEIISALMDPDNLPYIAKVIKIPEFKLPGADDRQKQYEEIVELINSPPIPPDPQEVQQYQMIVQQSQQTGQPPPPPPQEKSSVEIDPDVDNHQIEAAICKSWLISAAGQLAKKENKDGYKNVLLHMKAHLAIVQQAAQAQRLHDDQIALATGKPGQPTLGEVSDKTTPKKPEKKPGAPNASPA
ncbi:MAG: hypothetical protein E6H08_18735 [Bacteroidetes bacterium]|nr:MAG: hypothetical protein E6H08_18735 [Bacteroidota bacterium]